MHTGAWRKNNHASSTFWLMQTARSPGLDANSFSGANMFSTRCESIWLVVLMTVVASALEDDPHITKFTASDAQQYAQTSFRLASPV